MQISASFETRDYPETWLALSMENAPEPMASLSLRVNPGKELWQTELWPEPEPVPKSEFRNCSLVGVAQIRRVCHRRGWRRCCMRWAKFYRKRAFWLTLADSGAGRWGRWVMVVLMNVGLWLQSRPSSYYLE